MLESLLIAVFVVLMAFVLCTFFVKLVKHSIKKKDKSSAKQQSKPTETAKPKPDEFKISKKSRLSKVSKKALKVDSRSATVEPVFARTPPSAQTTQSKDIEVDQRLTAESEKFIEQFGSAKTGERKVVSFADIKKEQAAAAASAKTAPKEADTLAIDDYEKEWSSGQTLQQNLWSSTQARNFTEHIKPDDFYGHFTGSYSGIKVGAGEASLPSGAQAEAPEEAAFAETAATPNSVPKLGDNEPLRTNVPIFRPPNFNGNKSRFGGFDDSMDNPFMPRSPLDSPFGNPLVNQPQKKSEYDISQAVIGEAILNRKGKNLAKSSKNK